MKRQIFFAASLLLAFGASAQVTERVDFNNYMSASNNDYYNKFAERYGPSGLLQIIDSGITGGCLRVPANSLTAGSPDVYCSRYTNRIGAVFTTSFSFKWDTTAINVLAAIPDIVELRLYAHSTGNDLIWAHLYKDTKLHIYNWTGSSGASDSATGSITPLIQYHWYNLILTTNTIGGSFGDEVGITAQIYELGISGTSSAVLINAISTTRSNIGFVTDTAISIEMLAANWAGCTYIDDFSFSGFKSADSCLPVSTGVIPLSTNNFDFSMSPNPNNGIATINYDMPNNIEEGTVVIRSINGKVVKSYQVTNKSNVITIDNSLLPSGVYYYSLSIKGVQTVAKKMVVIK